MENFHEIMERGLDALGEHVLSLHAEGRDVAVGLQEVQELAAVGHPEREDLRVLVLLLDRVVNKIGHVMQEHRQLVGPLRRLQVGAVVGGSTVSGTKVERVNGREFEVWRVDVQVADDLLEELLLVVLGKLKDGRQNCFLSLRLHRRCRRHSRRGLCERLRATENERMFVSP